MISHFPRNDCCCRAGLTLNVCGALDQTYEHGCEKDTVLLFLSLSLSEVCFALEGSEMTALSFHFSPCPLLAGATESGGGTTQGGGSEEEV